MVRQQEQPWQAQATILCDTRATAHRGSEGFERAVSERHYWGMGLGLWVVQELVTRLGGWIDVESMLGQGATFTVYLPRRAPQAHPSR